MNVIKLTNTLTRKKEIFRPIRKNRVGLYTCGPTVYNYAHIGNLRTYIFEDILRRTLEYAGYRVRHVMNITDVGHLTSDADTGEDKMEREAKKEKRTVWDIARFYTDAFLRDIAILNIKKASVLSPATKNIPEQIKLIRRLFKKGLAYETAQAVYFAVSRFPGYTKLSGQKLDQKITGARDEIVRDPDKKNPHDFALWFKIAGHFQNHAMRWPSPWKTPSVPDGAGFPGWHIECSAISTKYLGQPFDIHTGGVDHISVHHANEIAQSQGAYARPLARVWMHGEFLLLNDSKMAKSSGGFLTMDSLIEKRFSPLAFRYLCLTAHYRSKLNFTFESLGAAQNSLERLYELVKNLKAKQKTAGSAKQELQKYKSAFEKAIADDLDTPRALATLWTLANDYNKNPAVFDSRTVLGLLYDFDEIFGFGLKKIKREAIPSSVKKLVAKREEYRAQKNWTKSDEIRNEIKQHGWIATDTFTGTQLRRE